MVVRAGPEQSHPGILLRGQGRFSSVPLWREKVLGGREMCSPESPLTHDRAGPRASGCPALPSHAVEMGKDNP